MDPVRADRMAQELIGHVIGDWRVVRFLGAGKSAVVFQADRLGQRCALKIFDPELIQRFGKETQLTRIEREKSLIGERHPHLVQIYDGGECAATGRFYVAMEFINASSLGSVLGKVPRDKIAMIIRQISAAARFLETKGLAHRDIKPDNIGVTPDFFKAVLLDLGVLRPFGDPSLTDDDGRVFVGTLRYSSPEFLNRTEQDTIEGWRAVTFYQLGAVLHDLIMRRPLFQEFTDPFAVLVEAVKSERPDIFAEDVAPDLILLAQNCLVKHPEPRLELVSWKDFDLPLAGKPSVDSARERVRKRSLLAHADAGSNETAPQQVTPQLLQRILDQLESIVRFECAGSDSFPPHQIIPSIGDSPQLRVIFRASPDRFLKEELSIRFDCELLDVGTMAIKIAISACLLPDGAIHSDPSSPAVMFRGPLDSASLSERVQEVLWCAVDLAQQVGSAVPAAGEIKWLNVAGDMEKSK